MNRRSFFQKLAAAALGAAATVYAPSVVAPKRKSSFSWDEGLYVRAVDREMIESMQRDMSRVALYGDCDPGEFVGLAPRYGKPPGQQALEDLGMLTVRSAPPTRKWMRLG